MKWTGKLRQCQLVREDGVQMVCWLPVELAEAGAYVVVKSTDEAWRVDRAYKATVDLDTLGNQEAGRRDRKETIR